MPETTDAQELARLRAVEAALIAEYNEPGHITKQEIREVLDTKAPPAPPAPEPVPAPVPVPVPTPEPVPAPPAAGRPNASNTGVPAGVKLTVSGGLNITQDGTVVDGMQINGKVVVSANGVTIRNSVINSTSTYPIQIDSSKTGFLLEDSEIDGNGVASVAILKGNYTLRRVNIHDVKDGPRIEGDNVLIEKSWIHDLTRVEGGHHDTLQIRKGVDIVIRNNSLEAYKPSTDDPMNAAIQFGSWIDAPPSNVLVENNYMDGGNFTINAGFPGLTVRGNTFGPIKHVRYAKYIGSLNGAVWEGNTDESGEKV